MGGTKLEKKKKKKKETKRKGKERRKKERKEKKRKDPHEQYPRGGSAPPPDYPRCGTFQSDESRTRTPRRHGRRRRGQSQGVFCQRCGSRETPAG